MLDASRNVWYFRDRRQCESSSYPRANDIRSLVRLVFSSELQFLVISIRASSNGGMFRWSSKGKDAENGGSDLLN